MNYAYEGEVKIPLSVRFQNAITKLITAIKKFILKIRSIKKEHVVPKKVLDAYRSLSRMCYNCMNRCKNSLLSGESARVIFTEPFESQEYKILFSDEIKEKAKPGEYVKIASSEVLNFMNVSLTIISNAKQGLRTIDKEAHPNRTQSFTQLINYAKFMLKISNRVLSYKNMYVEKRHLPTTKVEGSEGVNESYLSCMNEIDIAMEGIFGNLFKKKPKMVKTPEAKKYGNEIRQKTLGLLKRSVVKMGLDKEYKKAVCSYPAMDLKLTPNGIQISKYDDGILPVKDWPSHIKDRYYELRSSFSEITEEFPDAFDNQWYYDLCNEVRLIIDTNFKGKLPENFHLQIWNDSDGDKEYFIEVFEKVGEKATESYEDIAVEGLFKRNPYKEKEKQISKNIKNKFGEAYQAVLKQKDLSKMKNFIRWCDSEERRLQNSSSQNEDEKKHNISVCSAYAAYRANASSILSRYGA